MDPSPSADTVLGVTERELVLDIAAQSIHDALAGHRTRLPTDLPPSLRRPAAAFVTLHVGGELNGCIGSVTADEPLADAIARLARSAAFDDPRLPPLRSAQLGDLAISVSLLSPFEPVPAPTRVAVLEALEPGVHGLVIELAGRRGLFLPEVWASLPDGDAFLDHLLHKAGLCPGGWPRGIEALRFTTEHFSRTRLR